MRNIFEVSAEKAKISDCLAGRQSYEPPSPFRRSRCSRWLAELAGCGKKSIAGSAMESKTNLVEIFRTRWFA